VNRVIAALTAFIFAITSFQTIGLANSQKNQVSLSSSQTLPALIEIHLPEDLGEIVKSSGTVESSSPRVILIQDAHAIPAAQRMIYEIIEHYKKQYGVQKIAIEGTDRELSVEILKSFPDRDRLETVLNDLIEKGELTGAAASAILN